VNLQVVEPVEGALRMARRGVGRTLLSAAFDSRF